MDATEEQHRALLAKFNAELQAGLDQLDRGEALDGESVSEEMRKLLEDDAAHAAE